MVLTYTDLYSIQNPDSVVCSSNPECNGNNICTSNSCESNNTCYQYEYCRNKKNAVKLTSGKELAQMQEKKDVYLVYQGDYIKSINLIVGIVGVFSFIFYNK